MGWFSPIKGSYPSLSQIDKTLPVATGNTDIKRGMIIEMTNAGAFKIAENADNEGLLYISLQDYSDAQAGMAGTVGYEEQVGSTAYTGDSTRPAVGAPTITGLALSMDGEYETSEFNPTSLQNATLGAGLTVVNGKFELAVASEGASTPKVVAYLTATPASRWVNNAPANALGTRQGKNMSVIRFRTK